MFWFEPGPHDATVVAVGDTRTGKVQRLTDPATKWAVSAIASVGVGPRLCADFYISHAATDLECNWRLGPGGRALHAPSLAALGPSGARQIALETAPDGRRTVLLGYHKRAPATPDQRAARDDLRITVLDEHERRTHSFVLERGPFYFDDECVGQDCGFGQRLAPSVSFADATHAVVQSNNLDVADGPPGTPSRLADLYVVDITTGTVTKPCSGSSTCDVSGRYVLVDGHKLVDLASGEELSLRITPDEWAHAMHVPPCP